MLTSKHLDDVTGAIVAAQIIGLLIAIAELGLMFVVLTLILIASPFAAFVAALAVCLLGLVAAITGRGLPRLRGRIKGISVFAVAGIFAFIAQREARWVELRQTDPEAYLAELAPIDQERWLEELSELRPERYAEEIERRETALQAQREAEAAETARRAEVAAAERRVADARAAEAVQRLIAGSDDLDEHHAVFADAATELVENGTCTEAEFVENGGWVRSTTFDTRQVYFMYCGGTTMANRLYLDATTGDVFRGTDGRVNPASDENSSAQAAERLAQCRDHEVEAYTMIKADVRRVLVAPSTAEFPWRYDAGTGHLGDCLYLVNGRFDAQNGFGAMLRGTFTGTIRYFPERGSWQTQSLSVN